MSKSIKIKDLVPDDANFNTGTEFGNSLIDKSLSKFGAGRSILIDKNNRIIAGNKTIENAAANGFNDVVIVETTGDQIVAVKRTDIDLNTKKGREMALADNATAKANISWDAEALTDWDMPVAEWGIDLAEFAVEEVGEADAEPQIDKAAELNKKWKVKTGDLWQIGEHRLLCGDSSRGEDFQRLTDGNEVEAVITDPPYGIDWDTDYTRFTSTYKAQRINHPKVANDDKEFDPTPFMGFDKVVLWGANWYCKFIPIGTWLIWDKRHESGAAFLSDAEIAWMKGGKGVYLYAETVQGAHRAEPSVHPTQKPVGAMKWCIEKAGVERNVYEPFAGSGTTLVACQNLNRKCYAIEISENYCAVILQRMSDAFPELEIKRVENDESVSASG